MVKKESEKGNQEESEKGKRKRKAKMTTDPKVKEEPIRPQGNKDRREKK